MMHKKIHSTIKKVTSDIFERQNFNTAIAAMMELLNELTKFNSKHTDSNNTLIFGVETLVKLLSPIAPHITHKIWIELNHSKPVILEKWPQADENVLTDVKVEIIVQINGKLRSRISVDHAETENEVVEKACACQNINKYLDRGKIKKGNFVKNKLINFVI